MIYSMPKQWRARLHVILIVLVLIASSVAHRQLEMNWAQSVYETLRIFIVEADVDLPEGTPLAYWIWFLRFLAPALMAWGLLEMLRELGIQIPLRSLKNHIIIVGAGKVGAHVVQAITTQYPWRRIVVIDANPDTPGLNELRRMRRVKVIIADATSKNGILTAKVETASHVFVLTGDDIVNIDVATTAMGACEDVKDRTPPMIYAHVSDVRFSHQIATHFKQSYKDHVSFINIFQLAARELLEDSLRTDATGHTPLALHLNRPTLFLIAGFGRFGQALLDELTRRFHGRQDVAYRIIDSRGEQAWADYFRRSDTLSLECDYTPMRPPLQDDILSERVSEEIRSTLKNGWDVNLLISTDNDIRNLQLALEFGRSRRLRNLLGEGLDMESEGLGRVHLVTRLFRKPNFLVELSGNQDDEHNIKTFNLDELVVRNILSKLEKKQAAAQSSSPADVYPTATSS